VKFIILVLVLWSSWTWSQSSSMNLNIPTSPSSYASDRVQSGTFTCQSAIGSATNVEFGVVGFINDQQQNNPYGLPGFDTNGNYINSPMEQVKDVGVYARITIPIGGPKERINCNTLYELELQIKRMEVQKLTQEINNLRALKFVEE
jgi:hypothetical protein